MPLRPSTSFRVPPMPLKHSVYQLQEPDLNHSNFIPTCSACSTPQQPPGTVSVRGESAMSICRECHAHTCKSAPIPFSFVWVDVLRRGPCVERERQKKRNDQPKACGQHISSSGISKLLGCPWLSCSPHNLSVAVVSIRRGRAVSLPQDLLLLKGSETSRFGRILPSFIRSL